ncbi:MAG: AAA domain-containing protein [Promethearchaeota archaeon]
MESEKKKFNKQILTRFVQTECERQLFLDLSKQKPDLWRAPNRPIEKPLVRRYGSNNLERMGHDYEQLVFARLVSLKQVKYKKGANSKVVTSSLSPDVFNEVYNFLEKQSNQLISLLEYEYENPRSFFEELFNSFSGREPIPVEYSKQRPDILIIEKLDKSSDKVSELLPNNKIREIPEEELRVRYAISVIDVKNIRDINVGKKQFTEILYYMLTISYFLKEKGLTNKFFVRADRNGIFPRYNEEDLNSIKSFDKFFKSVIFLKWDESNQIFKTLVNQIKQLWSKSPCSIESIPVNIRANCGYCYYIEDCKKSLGMDGVKPPKEWSLKLIPYTSMSIAQQLLDRGFKTIGDMVDNLKNVHIGNTPESLYPELPLLQLKARSLSENEIIKPRAGEIHAYSIPKYSTIAINFAVESDPANQRVFAAGLYFFMSVSPKAPYSLVYENWWRIWKEGYEESKSSKDIQEELNKTLTRGLPLEIVEMFLFLLKKLKLVLILLKGEKNKDDSIRQRTTVIYQLGMVNEGSDDQTEAKFTKRVIIKLNYLLELCNIIENYLVTESGTSGRYYGPTTSLFYWSRRQLDNFQEMLERNLNFIIADKKAASAFESIISLFSPSESEVSHPYQHKKMFNIQDFAETIFGFPTIITYTWHEIAKRTFGTRYSLRYWIPHFNYMDFNNWYDYLVENDTTKKKELKKEIGRQMMIKARAINSLRRKFQYDFSQIISKHSRVINKSVFKSVFLNSDLHPISHVWYLFSKFTGSFSELEAEYLRTTYPDFSIGKLAAAKIDSLQIIDGTGKNVYCAFNLVGLSSNMKLKEGQRVYLIPNQVRDMPLNRIVEMYKVTIAKMIWSSKIKGYHVFTEETSSNFYKDYQGKEKSFKWYLYHTTIDAWSNKLYGQNGLLQRHHLGTSWLGARLAFLWNIRSSPKLFWPHSWEFSAPALYLFSPKLLLNSVNEKNIPKEEDLLTQISPAPDFSQITAIKLALNNVISGIQGPPGTGKSQTIAAFIDEYYERCKKRGQKSVKILVTCFSYAALRVIIDKIRNSKDNSNRLIKSAKLQKVFLRSQYQKPIDKKVGCRDIDDLVRSGKTWKLNGQSRSVTATHLLEESLEESFILFANAHQLFYLPDRVNYNFAFDLIVVDEASQLPIDSFMSSLQFVHQHDFKVKMPDDAGMPGTPIVDHNLVKNLSLESGVNYESLTKVVIVGDYNQLPPVQPVKPPKKLELILDSLFSYYVRRHGIPSMQLKVNYRSNEEIMNFTSILGIYEELVAAPSNASITLAGDINRISVKWVKEVLDPKKAIGVIIHDRNYEIGVSNLEAKLVVQIVISYYKMCNIKDEKEETKFWLEKLGVVAPHNAQGRLIIRRIFDEMTKEEDPITHLETSPLMKIIKNTVYSVEKFQGSDRDLIISSIGLSDKDQLKAESEFIYNLNRFNVLTSRAKAKIILIASKQFLEFIPMDRKIIEQSAHIRKFAMSFCNIEQPLEVLNEKDQNEKLIFRYRIINNKR